MTATKIEWCDLTWNPVRGCQRVSPGCANCYAEGQANRFKKPGQPYEGLVKLNGKGRPVWTGRARGVPGKLAAPLSWRRRAAARIRLMEATARANDNATKALAGLPGTKWVRSGVRASAPGRLRVFVNSMSDLFHEDVSNEFIAAVFGVMAACRDIDFLVLTKRPARMARWFDWVIHDGSMGYYTWQALREYAATRGVDERKLDEAMGSPWPWPLPNVHLGVSVEDQQRADERIPLLLQCLAAVRWVSAEPLLAPVDFSRWLNASKRFRGVPQVAGQTVRCKRQYGLENRTAPTLDWLVCGGESGPRARAYDLAWACSLIEQCKNAGTPVFHKQLGTGRRHGPTGSKMREQPWDEAPATPGAWVYKHPKGADISEWPPELQVREFPRTSY